MKKTTGVKVEKASFFDKKIKADFKKIFTVFAKSAIMACAGKPASAFKELVSIADAFNLSTSKPDLAYQLILTALINAAHHLAEENSHRFMADLEEAEKLYDVPEYMEFLEGISALVEDKEVVLEFEMIKDPRSIPILEDFKNYFNQYLILFGISEKDAELITNRLPSYFVFELNDEWRNNFTKYEPLLNHLDAPTAEAARKERQWEAYYTYLEREIEKPVFEESFSLKDIFIPLRAFYKISKKGENQRQEEEKIAVNLEAAMDEWLASNKIEDTIKVIQGGPGSGKSSFAKLWTAKLAKTRALPILFIPLHHFNIHTNIKTAIGDYFKDSSNIPLAFNPLEGDQHAEKILLVFDGLDELVMQGKSSQEAARAFMQELKDFCLLKNEGKLRMQVLVTGRPIAIQDTETKLRDGDQQILFLLPYFLNEDQLEEYNDPNEILEKDQRNQWWNHYFRLKGLSNHNLPAELKNEEMDKITTEPLLNYLVALSWKDAPENFGEHTNINDIYSQLMSGVYHRAYDKRKSKAIGDLQEDDFIQILEEIAVCAWQGGDARVTTARKVEKHINNRGLGILLEEYKASAKGGGISRLLTAFYFRKFGKEDTEEKDDTFEFTHKSFGEYLAARAIVELIAATNEERQDYKKKSTSRREKRKGWTLEHTLGEWLRMTGNNPIDEDLNQFIINEIKIRKAAGENIEEWQETLCEVINEVLATGLPFHLQPQRLSQLEERRQARNTEEALFVALANCSLITGKLSNLDWSNTTPGEWLHRLSSSVNYPHNLTFKNLINLNLKYANLIGVNLIEANLAGSNLEKANLVLAILYDVNLRKANLNNVSLVLSNLRLARLREVDLTEADLTRADLTEADLTEADLTEADLTGVDLTRADLTRADLTGVRNISFEKLLTTKSLYGTKGIPPQILEKIKKVKPSLLEKP